MDHVEYVYTEGVPPDAVDELLGDRGHGTLALADGDDAYAVPLNYAYDGERFLLRVSDEPGSEKVAYAESTATATFVVYELEDETHSWSVMIRGRIERLPEDEQDEFTDAWLNEHFPPFRLFDEAVPEVEMALYELEPIELTGRRTVD